MRTLKYLEKHNWSESFDKLDLEEQCTGRFGIVYENFGKLHIDWCESLEVAKQTAWDAYDLTCYAIVEEL